MMTDLKKFRKNFSLGIMIVLALNFVPTAFGDPISSTGTVNLKSVNQLTTVYSENFDGDSDNGWTHSGIRDEWERGVPSAPGPDSAVSGTNVWGTDLDNTYSDYTNSSLVSPVIDLTNVQGAVLVFDHWYETETNNDRSFVEISSDYGKTWNELGRFSDIAKGKQWSTVSYALDQYAGQRVQVRFRLEADNGMNYAGWYIDNVSVQASEVGAPDTQAPAAPSQLTGTVNSFDRPVLSWSPSADEDLKQYVVYRSTTSGSGYKAIGTTTETTFTDSTTENNTTYYYTVSATDYNNNESAKSNELPLTITSAYTTVYSENFDGDSDNGWTHSGIRDEWERGVPSAPGPASAVSGTNVWGTDLDNTYSDYTNSSLVSPVIDLTNAKRSVLVFDHWYETETNNDRSFVEISSDGGKTWNELGRFSDNTKGKQWSTVSYALDQYAGQRVQVRFRLEADNGTVYAGWYIDNVSVKVSEVGAPDTQAPAAPSQLTGTVNSFGRPVLSWSPSADEDLKQYVVYRSTASGSGYKAIGTTTETTFTDSTAENNTTYYYTVSATDYNNNESAKSNELPLTITSAYTTVYSENFDGTSNNGWTHSGLMDEWERGVPSAPGPVSAVSGTNVWGTDLSDKYNDYANASLVSPPINLTQVKGAILSFDNWYETETNHDYSLVEISSDGWNWKELGRFSDSTKGKQWSTVSYSLDQYAGQRVQIRFRLTADNATNYAGWYIDNVSVKATKVGTP